MNYNETIKYIENEARFGNNKGLERTQKILEFMGNPHKKLKCIHVAGTNGKGSVTKIISKVLETSGYKVGMYTSPYIEKFEERIQINGQNISKEDLSSVVSEVSEAVDHVVSLGYGNPTQFEVVTCAAFLYFYRKNVDFVVLEVGLGGRLDSTNVIVPIVSVITSISFDHMAILGNTIEEIASEKAGIIKKNVPVISVEQKKDAEDVIEKTCTEKNCELIKVSNSFDVININYDYQEFYLYTKKDTYHVRLSLLGKYQLTNCAAAICTIEELISQGVKIQKKDILCALSNVKWPGRLEVFKRNPLVVLDGAHNEDGMLKLKESIETYFKYDKIFLILGILKDKEVEKMISIISPMADKIIAVTPHNKRAESCEDLINIIKKYNHNCEYIDSFDDAYNKALSYCSKDDLLLISGSLYMIGDMRRIVKRDMEV